MALHQRLPGQLQGRSARDAAPSRIDEAEIWLGGIHATKRLLIAGAIGAAAAFLVFWIVFIGLMTWAVGALA
jgi:hypothetical protein